MRNLAYALSIILLMCGTANAQTAAMYRTVSPDGTVAFSDVPIAENSERINVLVRSAPRRDAAETETAEPAAEADSGIAAQIEANCRLAREQQQNLSDGSRIYRVLPSGERQFLSEEEIVAARQQAEIDVAQWCQQPG